MMGAAVWLRTLSRFAAGLSTLNANRQYDLSQMLPASGSFPLLETFRPERPNAHQIQVAGNGRWQSRLWQLLQSESLQLFHRDLQMCSKSQQKDELRSDVW